MMRRSSTFSLMLAAILMTGCAAVPEPARPAPEIAASQPLKRELDARAPEWLRLYDVPSVSVAYIVDGRLAWSVAYGERAPGQPATPDTLYNIASMTKPIVAETVLRLTAAGRLSLDEPMAAYWTDPDIADDPRRLQLTAAMALRHQSGFPNWRYETEDHLVFQADPGTRTSYSGEGYDYVARFAERRTGQDWESLANDMVFGPAGMVDTRFTGGGAVSDRASSSKGPDGSWRAPDVDPEWSAADNVRSTAADYARFLISVMDRQGITPALAIRRVTVDDDQTGQACGPERLAPEACPDALGFGLGWVVTRYPDETIIQHGGGDWGERTLGFYVPETHTGIVVFTNGANGMKVIRDVVALLHPNAKFVAFLDMQAR
ncbi:serine hydrolase domain-containing protein [uncultured Brevundimonas sp.]|uniref:serine hydrolase domain-containing protein n=1 Tax=uncultured Brevundimonas sp. TaxID=213418 RepID=UPI0030ED9142|tara:strand:+ start:1370 stop:2497 length:1128 start_codon:yes stop_codon:yes gene_type:complete